MSKTKRELFDTAGAAQETALIVQPFLKKDSADKSVRSHEEILAEIEGLAHAINLDICAISSTNLARIHPGLYFGKGYAEQISALVEEHHPDIVIVNAALSPVQQRNLERAWSAKVIDRTGLILEIFGARAQTKEGRIQVELAALEYQRSRLVRSWTHLERQRGGAGFMGGPGERQIELDKRILTQKMTHLKTQLEDVRRTRGLARESRAKVPFPVVALVGYTNAGKSTLFNALTGESVFAKDLLFATLDPTMRSIELPDGQKAILSDTVGFIADLPTHLIEAFRATLEQVIYADVILHVIDASNPNFEAQRQDVIDIMSSLGVDCAHDERVIEVYNKLDNLDELEREEIQRKAKALGERGSAVSALERKGFGALFCSVEKILSKNAKLYQFTLPATDGTALSWLYQRGQIEHRVDQDEVVKITARLSIEDAARFEDRFGYKSI